MITLSTKATMFGLTDELQGKILDFLVAGKTGNITLNVKDGRVLSWQFAEFGRPSNGNVDKEPKRYNT